MKSFIFIFCFLFFSSEIISYDNLKKKDCLAPKSSFLVSVSELQSLFSHFKNTSLQDRKKLLHMTIESIFQYYAQQEQILHFDNIKKILLDENLIEQKRVNGEIDYYFNNFGEKFNDYSEWIIGLGGSYIVGRKGKNIIIIPRKNVEKDTEGKDYGIKDVFTLNISEIENIDFVKNILSDILESQRILTHINLLKKLSDNDVSLVNKYGGFINAMSVGKENRIFFINSFIKSFKDYNDLINVFKNFMNEDYFPESARKSEAKSVIIEIIDNIPFSNLTESQISQIINILDKIFMEKEEDNNIELAVNETGTLSSRKDDEYGDIPNAVLKVLFNIPSFEVKSEEVKKMLTLKITNLLMDIIFFKSKQYPENSLSKILNQIEENFSKENGKNVDFAISFIKRVILFSNDYQSQVESLIYRIAEINNSAIKELVKEIANNGDGKYSNKTSDLAKELVQKYPLNELFINRQPEVIKTTENDELGTIELPADFFINIENTTEKLNPSDIDRNAKIYKRIKNDSLNESESNPKVRVTYDINEKQMNNRLQNLFLRKMLMEWIEFGVSKKDILKAYLVIDESEKNNYENEINSILQESIKLKDYSWSDLASEDFIESSKVYLKDDIDDNLLIDIVLKTYDYMVEIETGIQSDLTVGEETEFPYGKKLNENEKLFFEVFEKGNNDIEFKTFPSKSYLYQMFFARHLPSERDETSVHRTFRRLLSKFDSKIPYVISLLFTYALGNDNTLLGYQIPDETNQKGYNKRIWEMRYKNPLTTYGNVSLMEFTSWRHNMSAGLMTFLINLSVINPVLWHDICENITLLFNQYKINIFEYELNGFNDVLVDTENGFKVAKFQKDLTIVPAGKKESIFKLIISNPIIYEKIADSIIYVTEKMVQTSENNKRLYALEVLRELYMAVLSTDSNVDLEQRGMDLALKKLEGVSFSSFKQSLLNVKKNMPINFAA